MPEPPLPKGKEQSHLLKAPDSEGRKSQGEEQPHLGERGEDQSRIMERKGQTPQRRKAGSKEREGKQ